MTVKQEHLILGLIVVGAAGVILYLIHEGQSASAPVQESPGSAVSPGYPNSQPIQPFEVGGSPLNLTYNTFPADYSATGTQVRPISSSCGDGGCDGCGSDCDSCAQTQTLVSVRSVPVDVLHGAAAEFNSFAAKTSQPAPARQRVTFGTV